MLGKVKALNSLALYQFNFDLNLKVSENVGKFCTNLAFIRTNLFFKVISKKAVI